MVFGFLTSESQARIYSQVNACGSKFMGNAWSSYSEETTSFLDTEFVTKHLENGAGMLGSELARTEKGFPFSISNEFDIKIAIQVKGTHVKKEN